MAEKESLDNLQSYPVLTSETDAGVSRRPGVPGVALGQSVKLALYETLGRFSDPRGFVAALTQSFTAKEVKGRTIWEWKPPIYTVQADLGAVTGAQASIYKQAKVFLDESLPLLEGLKPLRSDYDEEDTEASRAIVGSGLTELVDELGLVGGPRVQRVDTHFMILLGNVAAGATNPENVEGQLGELRERFGLERDRVNTVEEEQNLTNYLVLVDYVLSLKRTWDVQRHFFVRPSADVYLGTHLVWISRALATLVESVYEARDAMDSVYFGEAERQTLYLPLTGEDTELTVAELLAWAERFGSEEGPRLIRDGGRDGVAAFLPTIRRLSELLNLAWDHSKEEPQNGSNPVRGFHTPRVRRTLEELARYTEFIHERAIEVAHLPGPFIVELKPAYGFPGTTVANVAILGSDFDPGAVVRFPFGDISVVPGSTVIHSTSEIEVSIDIHEAAFGYRDVEVRNSDGQIFTKVNGFLVFPPPDADVWEPVEGEPEEPPGEPRCTSFEPEGTDIGEWNGEMTIKGQVGDVQYVDLVHELFVPAYLVAVSRGLATAKSIDIDRLLDKVFLDMRDEGSILEAIRLWLRLKTTTTAIRCEVIGEQSDDEISVTFDLSSNGVVAGPWFVTLVDKFGRVAMCEAPFQIRAPLQIAPPRKSQPRTRKTAQKK